MNYIYWITDRHGKAKERFVQDAEYACNQFGKHNVECKITRLQICVGDQIRRYVSISKERDFEEKLRGLDRSTQIQLDENAMFSARVFLRLVANFREII